MEFEAEGNFLNAPAFMDRWGVRRDTCGPFWPVGLGPLGPPPNLRDNGTCMEGMSVTLKLKIEI